jgi:dynein heavy chain
MCIKVNNYHIKINKSIAESLGPEYGEVFILDLDATWAESEPRTPLICILSIGSDPSPQVTALAKQKEIRKCITLLVY